MKERAREGEKKKVYLLKGQMNTDDVLTHHLGEEKAKEERGGWMDLTDTAGFFWTANGEWGRGGGSTGLL